MQLGRLAHRTRRKDNLPARSSMSLEVTEPTFWGDSFGVYKLCLSLLSRFSVSPIKTLANCCFSGVIRQNYKQECGCLVHFFRLLAIWWPGAQSA